MSMSRKLTASFLHLSVHVSELSSAIMQPFDLNVSDP